MKKISYLFGVGVVSFVVCLFFTASFVRGSIAHEMHNIIATPEPTFTPTPAVIPTPAHTPTLKLCRILTVKVTAYSLRGLTFRETRPGMGTMAVDPKVIPLDSELFVPGYGFGLALDTGEGVIGNHVDIWLPTDKEAFVWGVKFLEVNVCSEPSH